MIQIESDVGNDCSNLPASPSTLPNHQCAGAVARPQIGNPRSRGPSRVKSAPLVLGEGGRVSEM